MAVRIHSTFEREILSQAVIDSFKKLNPLHMVKNPVMFVCEVGALITTGGHHFQARKRNLRLCASNCDLALVYCPVCQFCRSRSRRARKSSSQCPAKNTHDDHRSPADSGWSGAAGYLG